MKKIGGQDGLMTSLKIQQGVKDILMSLDTFQNLLIRKGTCLTIRTQEVPEQRAIIWTQIGTMSVVNWVQEVGIEGTTKRDWNRRRRTQGMRTTGRTHIVEVQEDMMHQTQVKIAIREMRKDQENMNLNPTIKQIGMVGWTEGLVTTPHIVDPRTKSIGLDLTNRRNLVVEVQSRCMIYPSDYWIWLWLHFLLVLLFGSGLKGGAT